MGELPKGVAAEARTDELKKQLGKVGAAFLSHREVSAQEAVYRLLSLSMKELSRSVVFVDTNPKHERIAVMKTMTHLVNYMMTILMCFKRALLIGTNTDHNI